MTRTVTLSKKNPVQIIKINPETNFFKIIDVCIPNLVKENNLFKSSVYNDITIKLRQNDDTDTTLEEFLLFSGNSIPMLGWDGKIPFNGILIDNDKTNKVELVYKNINDKDLEVDIHYTISNNHISITNPFENFKNHIQQKNNVKIFFSAPYGQGKTTFLNHFFEKHEEEYLVFRVFPVNYSISHNEDIFKYIKVELFFQLIQSNIGFDKEEFSRLLTSQVYFLNDPIRALSPLIPLIPKVGKGLNEFIKPLLGIFKGYKEFHKKVQKDDQKLAEEFVKELYEKEGTVFEDNFYTQLIRLQLEKIKNKTNKKNVLIIEDLDRMDPDHIFRILNVFTAQFDSFEYNDGYSNKFGFDKIIIVGDYNNIKHIFAHRYGPNVGFEGYINKYYSREPFQYDNKEAIAELVKDIKKEFRNNHYYIGIDLLTCVLNDLVTSEEVTLRDLIKLLKMDVLPVVYGQAQRSNKMSKAFYPQFIYFNLLCYLAKAFDIDSLIKKFEKCKHKHSKLRWKYDYFSSLGLPSLVVNEHIERKNFEFNYKSLNLTFLVKLDWEPAININYYNVEDLKSQNSVGGSGVVSLNRQDFYEILILNAKKYKEVGGFD